MTVAESKEFMAGDKVSVKESKLSPETLKMFNLKLGEVYEVELYSENRVYPVVKIVGNTYEFPANVFKLYIERSGNESSIARPVLEERKVGKVKMQLFDEGFPNAIMEIAKVMTWAETAKGYQPNDFKNLPNAETEFSAAASRHRVKGFTQKVNGVAALKRTDEESDIVHLAHAAFNILAELELVLTGKIK